jgi:hypothetical protein
MKRIFRYIYLILFWGSVACSDSYFEELNTNPTKATSIDPNAQLAFIELQTWGDWELSEPLNAYCAAFIQHFSGNWYATNYGGIYTKLDDLSQKIWNNTYLDIIRNTVDLIKNTEEIAVYQNVRSITRILQVHYFMQLTDLFGNIPYFDAGKAYIDGNVTPAYDEQERIYKDFLKELKESCDWLTTEGGTVSGDPMYKGDIGKWQRYANSLRLRVAMRLVKIEPELAKSEVINVLNSPYGLIRENEDALTPYTLELTDWEAGEFRRNALAQLWRTRDTYPTTYFCSTFWNHLVETFDPRLLIFGRCYADGNAIAGNPFSRQDITGIILSDKYVEMIQPADPGHFWWDPMPEGYWSETQLYWYQKELRPQINNIFLKGNTPGVLMTYAETEFLLAEAKVRWGNDLPDAVSLRDHYRNGVVAAMNFLKNFDSSISIPEKDINDYLLLYPFGNSAQEQIRMINEQLWILHLHNPGEAYANWRRSGYPKLRPSGEYGSITIDSEEIPRRITYPLLESTYNKNEYEKQTQKMGGSDNWNYRVWWDKE